LIRRAFVRRMAFALAATAFVDLERIAATMAPGSAANPWADFHELVHEVFTREIVQHVRHASPMAAIPSSSTTGRPFPLTFPVDLRYEDPE